MSATITRLKMSATITKLNISARITKLKLSATITKLKMSAIITKLSTKISLKIDQSYFESEEFYFSVLIAENLLVQNNTGDSNHTVGCYS